MIPARRGVSFFRFLLLCALLAGAGVLAFGVWANWNRDGDGDGKADGFTLRLTDPAWWTVSRERAVPLVEKTREMAEQMKGEVWGQGGYVDQAKTWLDERRKARAAAAAAAAAAPTTPTAPAASGPAGPTPAAGATGVIGVREPGVRSAGTAPAPAGPVRSPATRRLEEQFRNLEELFAEGLEHYEAANPSRGAWSEARAQEVVAAKRCFTQVRDGLDAFRSAYVALSDHDPALVREADIMGERLRPLLFAANKMSPVM